jgi:ABC-type sugar transport system substrate-binding protein
MTKWFIEKMDGKGDIVQITGNPGMPATIVRQAVVDRLLADTDINVLGSAPGSWSQTEAQAAMTTFLSTFDKIDGVLTEDVMAEGIIRAYETAGIDVPIMTGDYVMSFFRKWETMPELESVTTTFQPQASGDALSYAVRILNGWETNVEFEANVLDESIVNVINIPPSYCVTKESINGDEAWAQGYDLTQFISLPEALELGADLADTAALGTALTDEQWNAMFK